MGIYGPIPKRDDERMGHANESIEAREAKIKKDNVETLSGSRYDIDFAPEQPPANDNWHPIAKDWWVALGRSPEALWMTSAGWAVAYIGAEQLSRELKPQVVGVNEEGAVVASVPMKGASFAAHQRLWGNLGLTEGDRRRMGREVTLHTERMAERSVDRKIVSIADRREAALG